jgi:type I protein arginine methyltransferase
MKEKEIQGEEKLDYYFDSYSHFGIHEEMLKDTVRTMAYKNAILRNKHLFEGKVVLDVGCGTGILCMFAAEAGARLVIGVDMSRMTETAREIVKQNGFADKIVLLRGKMEEVQLPVDKVDIIISEWMGYCLLYESMLDTVLFARDRYLVKGGMIFPDQASMLITGIEDAEYKNEKINFWNDVYGYDMSCIREMAIREPLVDHVEGSRAVCMDTAPILSINIETVTKADLTFATDFSLRARRADWLHAFLVYFTCTFSHGTKPLTFSTGPFDKYTHWKQTIFYLPVDVEVELGDAVSGKFVCSPNARNHRELDISIEYSHKNSANETSGPHSLKYHMC